MPNKKRKNSIDTRRKKKELYKTRKREGSEIGRGREEKGNMEERSKKRSEWGKVKKNEEEERKEEGVVS